MIDTLKLFAIHNIDTNEQLLSLLKNLPEEELTRNRMSYYESLYGLVFHMMRANRYLLMMLRKFSDGKYCTHEYTELTFNPENTLTFQEVSDIIKEYNLLFSILANTITEEDLNIKKENTLYDETKVEVCIWEILTQYITHQSYHKGQVSQILDEMDIEHDLANIWPYVKQI